MPLNRPIKVIQDIENSRVIIVDLNLKRIAEKGGQSETPTAISLSGDGRFAEDEVWFGPGGARENIFKEPVDIDTYMKANAKKWSADFTAAVKAVSGSLSKGLGVYGTSRTVVKVEQDITHLGNGRFF